MTGTGWEQHTAGYNQGYTSAADEEQEFTPDPPNQTTLWCLCVHVPTDTVSLPTDTAALSRCLFFVSVSCFLNNKLRWVSPGLSASGQTQSSHSKSQPKPHHVKMNQTRCPWNHRCFKKWSPWPRKAPNFQISGYCSFKRPPGYWGQRRIQQDPWQQ